MSDLFEAFVSIDIVVKFEFLTNKLYSYTRAQRILRYHLIQVTLVAAACTAILLLVGQQHQFEQHQLPRGQADELWQEPPSGQAQ